MLLRFSLENHLSFRNLTQFSLVASNLKDHEGGLVELKGMSQRAISAAVIYGANASGKSNIVNALANMRQMILFSHSASGPDDYLPYIPFAFDRESVEKPTYFEIDFICDTVRYNYSFSYNKNTVLSEALYSFPNGRAQMLFNRDEDIYNFGRKLKGRNQVIADLTRHNSLFLSCAVQNDHDDLTPIYRYFGEININSAVSVSGSAVPEQEKGIDPRVMRFLDVIGAGVVSFRFDTQEIPESNRKLHEDLLSLLAEHIKMPRDQIPDQMPEAVSFRLGHRSSSGEPVFLDFARESAGTRRLVFMLSRIFQTIDEGGVVLVDELDASLHTQAFELILAIFCHTTSNPKGAQIIATVHDTNILNCDFMRRDQIWFAEKNNDGVSRIFSLSDIKLRKEDNFERGYLEGRFGALPFSDSLEHILGTTGLFVK